MKDTKALQKNKRKFYIYIGTSLVLFFIVVSIVFVAFHRSLKQMELERSYSILKEVSQQNSQTMKAILNTSLNDMNVVASTFRNFKNSSYDIKDAEDILKDIFENTWFSYIAIADKNGVAKTTTGQKTNVKEESFFQYAINGAGNTSRLLKKPLIGEYEFANAVPLYNEKDITGVLYGVYDVNRFSKYMQNVETKREYYFGVIQQNGAFVLWPQKQSTLLFEKNFWQNMQKAELSCSIEQIKKDMQQNKSRMISYVIDQEQRYLYYEPYYQNGWYIISIMNPESMENRLQKISYMVWQLLAEILIVFILMAVWTAYWLKRNRTEIEQIAKRLKQNETSFAIAVSQGAQVIFDYDIETKRLTFRYKGNEKYGFEKQLENVPESLIEKKIVLKDSAEEFLHMFEAIARGEKSASCVVRMKKHNGKVAWDKITMTNIFSKEGSIIQTVGILEDTTELKENEMQMAEEMEFRRAMVSDAMTSYEINITKDYMIKRKADEVNDSSEIKKRYAYTKCLQALIRYVVYPQDSVIVLSAFSKENMLYAFEKKKKKKAKKNKKKTKKGEYIWVECAVHFFEDKLSKDVKGFMVIRDINVQKDKELRLKKQADMDFLTNIYNRATTEQYITEIVSKQSDSTILHAFLICDLDNFKAINDTLGHQMGDKTLVDTAELLKHSFRKTDIIGRLGGDEFIILMQDVGSLEAVKGVLEKLIKQLDRVYGEGEKQVRTTASIGISISPLQGRTFETLYAKADKALYGVKHKNKNGFAFFEENDTIK